MVGRAGVAIALLACVAACTGEEEPSPRTELVARYSHPHGWRVSFPKGMHVERSVASHRLHLDEVTVATFEPEPPFRTSRTPNRFSLRLEDPTNEDGRFPAEGVAFRIVFRSGGPAPRPESPETRFPLRLADFRTSDWRGGRAPRPVQQQVFANGREYTAFAWVGQEASAVSRRRLADVVSSLWFPATRTGSRVGSFTVLEKPEAYPIGSVTRVRAGEQPFYLVHAPGGFYAVGWEWQSIHGGYKSLCSMQIDRRRLEFVCPSQGARWDRIGRVLERPRHASFDDPLNVTVAKLSHDGRVLLHPGVARFADRRFARELWPGWRPKR